MISNAEYKAIAELDLDPIKVKLMHKESGEGWTLEHANKVEVEYRRHLYLMKMFPGQTAPVVDVDTFWHYHILDTMKYAVDCDVVFGFFLHHFPYLGMRGEDDAAALERMGDRARELYEETFGEPCGLTADEPAAAAWCSDGITQAVLGNKAAAWCSDGITQAVPGNKATAWCSEDITQAATGKKATAWCSEGITQAATGKKATAWCSDGITQAVTGNRATAWCSDGLTQPVSASKQATAWCSDGVSQAVYRFYSERPVLAAA
jgi:uncharacterized protein YidB (DUF937 family)